MRRSVSSSSLLFSIALTLVACAERPTEPTRAAPSPGAASAARGPSAPPSAAAALVRQLAAERGIVPLRAPVVGRQPLVRLGEALLFDPILSGNRDISCATCHVPRFGTGDARSLSIGQGATGLGPDRKHPLGTLIPRNAPPLFNLGAMKHLFWDGRVARLDNGTLETPAGSQLTPEMARVLEFGPASALALFPVTNRAEMRGDGTGNELAAIPDSDLQGIWKALMKRLGEVPEYRGMFQAAYPGKRFEELTFAHASNAIGAFMIDRMSFTNTPWDRFLAGDDRALSAAQLDGAQTFLTLKCSICHNGATFSDEQFHNVAVPQLGPGEGHGDLRNDDFGRAGVTGSMLDRYKFRTTPLRNVELTAPYGHDGAILTLRDFVRHYSESDKKLREFDASVLDAPLRGSVIPTAEQIIASRDPIILGVVFDDTITDKLMAYMSALTDDAARDMRKVIPARVPSGLPVVR